MASSDIDVVRTAYGLLSPYAGKNLPKANVLTGREPLPEGPFKDLNASDKGAVIYNYLLAYGPVNKIILLMKGTSPNITPKVAGKSIIENISREWNSQFPSPPVSVGERVGGIVGNIHKLTTPEGFVNIVGSPIPAGMSPLTLASHPSFGPSTILCIINIPGTDNVVCAFYDVAMCKTSRSFGLMPMYDNIKTIMAKLRTVFTKILMSDPSMINMMPSTKNTRVLLEAKSELNNIVPGDEERSISAFLKVFLDPSK
jgi:hypothetical protein